jgi:hypothetical protein
MLFETKSKKAIDVAAAAGRSHIYRFSGGSGFAAAPRKAKLNSFNCKSM